MWILGGLACLSPGAAAGGPGPNDEIEHWVPALALYSGVIAQDVAGTAESTARDNGARGDDLLVNPFAGVTAELMTPSLSSAPGQPRLFLHGDILPQFGFNRSAAREGAPNDDPLQFPAEPNFPEEGIRRQGSKTDVEMNSPVLAAGAGVAFTLDLWDRRLRLKPSIEYIRERMKISGVVKRAQLLDLGRQANPRINSTFRRIEMRGRDVENFHGLGPGLELEADTLRTGPFMMTIFLSGKVYRMLGDQTIRFAASSLGEIVGPGKDDPQYSNFGPETAVWTYEHASWSYQTGVGLRFRWLPE